jgi:hypothetical protein
LPSSTPADDLHRQGALLVERKAGKLMAAVLRHRVAAPLCADGLDRDSAARLLLSAPDLE